MPTKTSVALALSILMLGFHATAQQQQETKTPRVVFKVISKDGRVSYVDRPGIPIGANAIEVTGRQVDDPAKTNGTKYQTDSPNPAAMIDTKQSAVGAKPLPKEIPEVPATPSVAEQKALKDAQDQLAKHQCEIAKQNMASLNRGRVAKYSAEGERHFLSDNEIATEKTRTQAQIAEKCSSAN